MSVVVHPILLTLECALCSPAHARVRTCLILWEADMISRARERHVSTAARQQCTAYISHVVPQLYCYIVQLLQLCRRRGASSPPSLPLPFHCP